MSENERIEEYREKIAAARKEYQSEFADFMERSRNYTILDQGSREETEIRKRFSAKLDALTEEYSDAVEAIRRNESGEK